MELIKTEKEAFNECKVFFNELSALLSGEQYEVMRSCNNDKSLYLIPKGTIAQLSYNSKPADSYRYSDHWNWYANVNKCADPHYIQCYCVDMPWAKKRSEEGKPSKPIG